MSGIVRSVGRLAAAARIAARTALPVDSNPVPGEWEHVTKVDPEDGKRLPLAFPLYLRHTDAVSVGGSRDVTSGNTEATFELLGHTGTPAFHEPSAPGHVTSETREAAAFVAIPEVLNGSVDAMVGTLGDGIEYVRDELAPERIDSKAPWLPDGVKGRLAEFAASWMLASANFEAYIIQNPDSAAAREAGVTESEVLGPEAAAHRAMAAERRLGSEIVYVEYSGTYGGEEGAATVAAAAETTHWARIWYGGGIDSREAALRMLEAGADAVVVGDAFHDVAEQEAQLCARALDGDDLAVDADRPAVREWVRDRAGDGAAARYLSTIPAVADPERRAVRYLTAAVDARLAIARVAADLDDDATVSDLRTALRGSVPGEEAFADLGDRGRAYAYESALAVLGHQTGVGGGSLPVAHLGVDPRAGAAEPTSRSR
jgi:phosphoglycerol geranylgeranyltransferase